MRAKKDDKVKVHYTLKLGDGEVVESSKGALPMEFTIGAGNVVPGFEKGVIGMKAGDTKTITVPSGEAYGPHEEKKIFEYGKERIPTDLDMRVGQVIQMHAPDGSKFPVTVTGVTEKGFQMDANHPLAGKELTFNLELVEIINKQL
ncbi:MAG TPA: peptidylprolyl isomerase [Nitrospirae bacterium]|nr:FKBP-type peptidyl-prolyl cis-trans isomerase SlyD [bacterium BMS3Abin10]GBE39072.1 FKBP-type peptidyl-prolyl cis-trans isomerase SlyD [bacterium BMS3Bbin08]HDH00977.1 peptidylprolyl isomerase [Nitrospirota bacterium]HDH50366.1 peptidylprolyl isomerase [Nitrospirota bacterium]HDK81670.1 peptidylprolyl isomerase [Nitrospirota bacterium]